MVKRVMLIYPPIIFNKNQSIQGLTFPIGLAYIAAVLEQNDYEVTIYDAAMEGYYNIEHLGGTKYIYGSSERDIKEVIKKIDPQVVGICCFSSTLHGQTLRMAKFAKEANPNIITVTGGSHPSVVPDRLLEDENMDFCVIGEGEYIMLDLMNRLSQGKPIEDLNGIAFKSNKKIIVNSRSDYIQDLDAIPFPAWHLTDIEKYIQIEKPAGMRMDGRDHSEPIRFMQVFSSRGCPNHCTFCGCHAVFGHTFRTRSAKNVLDEIEILVKKYNIERIGFYDDNLTFDKKRAMELFDGIIERKFNITWEGCAGLQLATLDDELLEKMKESGCEWFFAPVESGNKEVLRKSRKPVNLEKIPAILAKAKELGIVTRGCYMIGFLGETHEQLQDTIDISKKLDLQESKFSIVTPYPGTEMYDECVEKGLIEKDIDFEDFSYGTLEFQISEISVEELRSIRKIQWIMSVFSDKNGHLKKNIPMDKGLILEELEKGLELYPDNVEITKLYKQAKNRYKSNE